MKTIQMTLDDDLVSAVDTVVKKMHMSRSAFTRRALRDALRRITIARLEQKHRKGYNVHPSAENEFSVWEKEQSWGEKW
jgi:metal-responsive CopG/Arc/MetJ family transcriptional regulator